MLRDKDDIPHRPGAPSNARDLRDVLLNRFGAEGGECLLVQGAEFVGVHGKDSLGDCWLLPSSELSAREIVVTPALLRY